MKNAVDMIEEGPRALTELLDLRPTHSVGFAVRWIQQDSLHALATFCVLVGYMQPIVLPCRLTLLYTLRQVNPILVQHMSLIRL